MTLEKCQCGQNYEHHSGPTHAFLGASAGCWKAYGQVLALEYKDPKRWEGHRYTVDAYACQHPGRCEPRTIESINLHLVSLCLVLERGMSTDFATQNAIRIPNELNPRWIEPPTSFGSIGIADLLRVQNSEEHLKLSREYAREVWQSWGRSHALIHKYCDWICDSVASTRPKDLS